MKNILILADGSIAKHFIEWIGRKRVAENKYFVVSYKEDILAENMPNNITLINMDPTSFSKLDDIMSEVRYSNIFIIMESIDDVYYSLKNIRLIDNKLRVVLVNQWDNDEIGKDTENITILNSDELLAGHLYDNLPNVPVVAQNVGLGSGEIMEIHVPFGSTYAYRHVGSILQRKWKISAIYRKEKQILPTNATMIRPNDTLLVLGKPLVLDGVYKTINKRTGLFPEPFGKDIYLLLDFRYDQKNALLYIHEAMYLLDKLEDKKLHIRIIYPNNFTLIDKIRAVESKDISLSICYDNDDLKAVVEYDIHQYNIGLIFNSIETFEADNLKETLYNLRKVVYLFGEELLYNIKECVILMSEDAKMESISSTAFDVSESLSLKLRLCDFDPEGEFMSKEMIVEHYETLTNIFNTEISIEHKVANPIRELTNMQQVLQIAPFENHLNGGSIIRLISTKIQDFLLASKRHPKLLVPFAINEG
ncbi:MAG: hypothetical protein U9O24_10155 [Campylobacterota bacterium]|nr:hypothetical protein [Campylobacterota bacterium]